MENKYLNELKKLLQSLAKNRNIGIYLFGSRARGDNYESSDVDIGILPNEEIDVIEMASWREIIENSNIPYHVELVNLNEVSDDFKEEIMKDAIAWIG
ncbi:MAG: nucleotidyltransferase domain-containing protein [Syntrophaceae bacterium]